MHHVLVEIHEAHKELISINNLIFLISFISRCFLLKKIKNPTFKL